MRALAFTLAVALLAAAPGGFAAGTDPAVEASAPVFDAKFAAPPVYTKLWWIDGNGGKHLGYWYTAEQVAVIDRRITHLEEKAAKECVDTQITIAKKQSVWWQIGGAVLAGAAIGYCAGSPNHCGIGK